MNVFLKRYHCLILCYVAFWAFISILCRCSFHLLFWVLESFSGFSVITQVKSNKRISLNSKRKTNLGFNCSFDFFTFSASCLDNNEWLPSFTCIYIYNEWLLPLGVIVQFWGTMVTYILKDTRCYITIFVSDLVFLLGILYCSILHIWFIERDSPTCVDWHYAVYWNNSCSTS